MKRAERVTIGWRVMALVKSVDLVGQEIETLQAVSRIYHSKEAAHSYREALLTAGKNVRDPYVAEIARAERREIAIK